MAGTRREENLDEGNNNGLEGVVKILEQVYIKIKKKDKDKNKDKDKDNCFEGVVRILDQVYTDKDQPGASPSLDVSLRCHQISN